MPKNQSAIAQYLVIGDSISLGMNRDLTQLVKEDGWELVSVHGGGDGGSGGGGGGDGSGGDGGSVGDGGVCVD